MADSHDKIDPEVLEYLESVNKSIQGLAEEVRFLSSLTEKTLLIQIRLAYILERVSNKTFNLDEAEDEPDTSRIERRFEEIKALFDQQRELMREGALDDE